MKFFISGSIDELLLNENLLKRLKIDERFIINEGHDIVNPMEELKDIKEDKAEIMRLRIKMLLNCDAIYMIVGYSRREECRIELKIAETLGLKIYYQTND